MLMCLGRRVNDWPLIILAHQMVMRPTTDTYIRTWMDSETENVFPWLS